MNDLLAWFDCEFDRLDSNWRKLISDLDSATFYSAEKQQLSPAAEQILRSARIVEQACGGITANLWDDPFEWTLPETITSKDKLNGYLEEVRDARARAFRFFKDDAELLKTIMAPGGPTQLASLLLDTLVRAGYCQLQAKAYLQRAPSL